MRAFSVGIFLCISVVACTTASAADKLSNVFQPALAQVKAKTQVAILLPSKLPAPIKEKDIHFSDGKAELNKYEITLYYDAGAGDAAFVGYFSGEANGKLHLNGKKVALANGATGYFKAKSCGGSCSPSQIKWHINNVLYTLQLKLGAMTETEEESSVALAANSAILGGVR